ncbi:MAG TPA: HAD-IB family hydrolase [Burkholderiaceae bacterium]|nr:HAD-IB family hydrolase [Burkholderiaceae bacterium]
MARLALFDLDHTLLSGDSDVLWCEFLMNEGVLDRATFEPRNEDMARRYQAGTVTSQEFCEFYVGTLAGRSPMEWRPLCRRLLDEIVAPLIPPSAHALVDAHRARGDRLVLTTATNRVLTELTAQHLRIDDLIASEVEIAADGRCTGRTEGTLNMRAGKVARLHVWLGDQGLPAALLGDAVFYSDSANDRPLLDAVGEPVAVDPDERLRAHALAQRWRIITLDRGAFAEPR